MLHEDVQQALEDTIKDAGAELSAAQYQSILDSFRVSAIYVISENDHRILYYNRKMKQLVPDVEVGKICYEVLPCDGEKCPVKQLIDKGITFFHRDDTAFGGDVEVFAIRLNWGDEIRAVLVSVHLRYQVKTIAARTVGMSAPIALIPTLKAAQKLPNSNVVLGQYSESMYYLDGTSTISDQEQATIDRLLFMNQGVGIIAGYFDENYTIRMMSGLAARTLNYSKYDDFYANTQAGLLNMTVTEEERNLLRSRLSGDSGDLWSFPFRGKDNKTISVRISNLVGTSPEGEKTWYMSIRRFYEDVYDSLTGAMNRNGFVRKLSNLREKKVDLQDYAVLYFNLRGFKAINNLYGSESGDELLVSFYKTLMTCRLYPEACARRDSDHFMLLVRRSALDFQDLTNLTNVRWSHKGQTFLLNAVCGIYYIEDPQMEAIGMIDCARAALKQIQDEYVTPYAIYDKTYNSSDINRIQVLSNFDKGIAENEFKIYYQPIVDAKTERVVTAEALVRWITKERGVVPPGMFIPELEQSGYIVKLDRYVVEQVNKFLRAREQAEQELIPISVNVSQMDFFDTKSIDKVLSLMKSDPFLCKYIHLEITESAHATVQERQYEFIKEILKCNGSVYIDDFGSGTASMRMLGKYKFNTLKIDIYFITEMVKSQRVSMLVEKFIEIAHELGMKVIAEGVETEQQLSILRAFNCDYIQGYYFSKPLDESHFIEYLNDHM